MKNRPLISVAAVFLALVFSLTGCSFSQPSELSYTQTPDPKASHITSGGEQDAYAPEGESKGKIFIDPGHGFSDPGTLSPDYDTTGMTESSVVLDVCMRLQKILVADGYEVKMTRTTDYDVLQETQTVKIQPEDRAAMANEWGADLLLSVHLNSYEDDPTVNSFVACYTTKDYPDDGLMDLYATYLLEAAVAQTGQRDIKIEKNTKAKGYWVNTTANMPSILFELGFITNAEDVTNYENDDWKQKAAQGLADGIEQFSVCNEYKAFKGV